MKPHRIFIAINLPDRVKDELLAYQERWPELSASSADGPARWTAPDSLHLTLAFLGNTSDQELEEVCRVMKQVGARHQTFSIEFNKIVYGPLRLRSLQGPEGPSGPRMAGQAPKMIWAIGKASPQLLALQKDITSSLAYSEDYPFSPHLTLARLKVFELQRMEVEELPDVNEEISVSFEVQSIEVMESTLRRSGAEYTIVQSFMLRE